MSATTENDSILEKSGARQETLHGDNNEHQPEKLQGHSVPTDLRHISPPNGGFQAWLQIAGAHFLFFNSWGVVLSFGAFQEYYTQTLLKHKSPSDITWIGTSAAFCLLLVGIITGPIFDRGHVRPLIYLGSFLTVFGIMMTSLSTEYYQIFLAQGLCLGLGAGCLFLPSVAIAVTYFSSKRAFATGLTTAGGSIGGVIYPIIFQQLLPRIGFGWTIRVIGFVALATLVLPIVIMKQRSPPPAKARALFDVTAWRNPCFVVFSVGLFFGFLGFYLPFFFMPTYASARLGLPDSTGFYLVSVLNAASIFGRIIPGLLADKLGSLNILVFAAISSGIVAFGWIGVVNLAGAIVFCILYGFLSGAIVSLQATVIPLIAPDLSRVGTWMGMAFALAGLGVLIGNPIGGAIIDVKTNQWLGGQLLGACMVLICGLLFLTVRLIRLRQDQKP